jgi:hypothetical protein
LDYNLNDSHYKDSETLKTVYILDMAYIKRNEPHNGVSKKVDETLVTLGLHAIKKDPLNKDFDIQTGPCQIWAVL